MSTTRAPASPQRASQNLPSSIAPLRPVMAGFREVPLYDYDTSSDEEPDIGKPLVFQYSRPEIAQERTPSASPPGERAAPANAAPRRKKSLKSLKRHAKKAKEVPAWVPCPNNVVLAQWSGDGHWYVATVLNTDNQGEKMRIRVVYHTAKGEPREKEPQVVETLQRSLIKQPPNEAELIMARWIEPEGDRAFYPARLNRDYKGDGSGTNRFEVTFEHYNDTIHLSDEGDMKKYENKVQKMDENGNAVYPA
ncbi:hypothetical protein LTR50_002702 [Elasticomyces elasticus]|nr:hypothetical protein LTR50_002702 [Elasticomyces elasticus]